MDLNEEFNVEINIIDIVGKTRIIEKCISAGLSPEDQKFILLYLWEYFNGLEDDELHISLTRYANGSQKKVEKILSVIDSIKTECSAIFIMHSVGVDKDGAIEN